MNKVLPALSRGMLILGGLLILAGLGWGAWMRVHAPPEPVITDAGAVVLAETAPPKPTGLPATAAPTATPAALPPPTQTPSSEGPTPALLPDWTVTPSPPAPTPTSTPPPPPPAQKPPTRIVAPSIELDAPVTSMGWEMVDRDGTMSSQWKVPGDAAGWHLNSALPGHGENVVLSGHHNIEGKVFRYVVDLHLGDEITLYVDDAPYRYIVTDKYILKEMGLPTYLRKRNAQWIMPTGDERLTLVTCWPYEWPGNSHRVIVVARPEGYADEMGTGVE